MSMLIAWLAIGIVGVAAIIMEKIEGIERVSCFEMVLASLGCLLFGPLMYPIVDYRMQRDPRYWEVMV